MFPGRCEDRNKGECESRARNDFTKCAWNGTSCYTVPIILIGAAATSLREVAERTRRNRARCVNIALNRVLTTQKSPVDHFVTVAHGSSTWGQNVMNM
eukprot:sb/3478924/